MEKLKYSTKEKKFLSCFKKRRAFFSCSAVQANQVLFYKKPGFVSQEEEKNQVFVSFKRTGVLLFKKTRNN